MNYGRGMLPGATSKRPGRRSRSSWTCVCCSLSREEARAMWR
jgi:hypothetical protein